MNKKLLALLLLLLGLTVITGIQLKARDGDDDDGDDDTEELGEDAQLEDGGSFQNYVEQDGSDDGGQTAAADGDSGSGDAM